MANVDGMVDAAIRAFKAGNREEAQTLLIKATERDQMHENAWMWLSAVVGTQEDQRVCLENVLYINPDNERAQRGMALLDQGDGSDPVDIMGDPQSTSSGSPVSTTRATPQADDAFADAFADAIEQDIFAGIDLDSDDDAPSNDTFDDIFADVEVDDAGAGPFGSAALDFDMEEETASAASSASRGRSQRPQSPGRESDPMGLDVPTDGQGGLYTGDNTEPTEERDPGEYFRAIPKDIKATRLPGSDEKYPFYIMPGIAALVLLNLFALVLFITNL